MNNYYVLLIWSDFEVSAVYGPYGTKEAAEEKGKVFDRGGWQTTVMVLGRPEDIDQE